MGDHQPAYFAGTNPADEFPQAPFVIVEPGTQIAKDFKPPAVRGAKGLQQLHLPLQIRFLVVAGYPGIGERDPIFWFWLLAGPSAKAGQVIPAMPARCPLHLNLPFRFPAAQRLRRHSQFFGCFSDRNFHVKILHNMSKNIKIYPSFI